jgi:hypothetical protein
VSLVLLARKCHLCLLCFVIGGCGTWTCPCWRSVHLSFHSSKNAYTLLFFCYLILRPYAGSLDSVRCVVVCFGFLHLLGLVLKPPVVGIKCFIFSCYVLFAWFTWSGWCPPVFFVLSFILCLIYLR